MKQMAPFLLLLLAQCCAAGQDVKITYWRHNAPAEIEAIQTLIGRYEKANPTVRITLRTFPYGVYTTKLVATLSTGHGPDIINIHNSWAYGYIKSGLIVPVPGAVIPGAELRDRFFPMLSSFQQHGVYYGVPIGATNLALFYNRRLLRKAGLSPDRPPRTWAELKTMAKKLTKVAASGRIVQSGAAIGLADGQGWNYFIEGVLRQAGVPVINADHRSVGWNTPAGIEAFRWFTGFVKKDRINSHLLPGEYDAFRLELTAMNINGSFQIGHLATVAPNLDYGVVPLPAGPGGRRATYGSLWGNCVTAVASPRNRAAAWRFVAYLSRYDNQKFWSAATGELPMLRRVLTDHAFRRANPRFVPFIDQLPHSHATVKKDEPAYKAAITEAVEEVIYNDLDPATALQRAASRIDRMLSSK